MRLLNTSTFSFKVFNQTRPEYAILSHMWGSEEDEVSFQDIQFGGEHYREKKGFLKITRFCEVANQNGYQWAWVDTCCIDKSSSAELSEAINSMYHWYKESDVCYAYLEDVENGDDLSRSRWFLRGWTLQELLAPEVVEFYDVRWREFGTKYDMRVAISKITGIDVDALRGSLTPQRFTIAIRMSWAANRTTTREEDIAYSLMGIFEVNMPLLYGEGKRAFHRLQEEILKISEDYTMLAWRNRPKREGDMSSDPTSILAKSPWDFRNDTSSYQAGGWDYTKLQLINWNPFNPREDGFNWQGCPPVVRFQTRPQDFEPPRKTARGLRVTLPFIVQMSPSDEIFREANLAFLYCFRRPIGEMACLVLREQDGINSSGAKGQFYRPLGGHGIHFVAPQSVTFKFRTVYIRVNPRDNRWSRYLLGYPGPLALVLLGAAGAPMLYKQDKDKYNFLIHLRCGSSFVRLLVSTGVSGKWCNLSMSPNHSFDKERELCASGIWKIYDEDFHLKQNMHTSLLLHNGELECTLKARPEGWLEMPHIAAFGESILGLKKAYSLFLQLRTDVPERPPAIEILGTAWF